MKNRQINKVLLMFFLSFTLFFSVSNAEWPTVPTTTVSKQSSSTTSDTIAGYSLSSIRSLFKSDVSDRNTMLEAVKDAGYYVLWIPYKDDLSEYYTLVFPISSNVDFGANTDGLDTSTFYFYPYFEEEYEFYRISVGSSSGYKAICTQTGRYNTYSSNGFTYSTFKTLISEDSLKFGNIPYLKQLIFNSGYYWDGESYYKSPASEPEIPTMSDDELANIINVFLSSEDLVNNRPSGYDDYYIIYDNIAKQYYAYLYKSSLNLAMRYGDWDDNDNFSFNDLSTGEGYRIFHHGFEGDLNLLEELWATISEHLSNSKYYCFRINPEVNKCHYITSYTDDVLYYATSQRNIVYSTKEISLLVGDGLAGTTVDTENSIPSKTLINSSTNEEYEFNMPSVEIASTPWERFISVIQNIPTLIMEKFHFTNGFTLIISLISPLISSILAIFRVLIASISLVSRAVTFVYTLPTIEASRALFDVDVAATEGLSFVGNSWGSRVLEGIDMIRDFSWNGLNLWNLFVSFIIAMFAIQVIKYIRKHYHY